jgi:guanine deaminase
VRVWSRVRALADSAKGQRAFVGKCNMDRHCPASYIETTDDSLATTKSFLKHFNHYPSTSERPSLVQPILTPRFAISCTDQLLASLGELANSTTPSIAIQTHLSENLAEIEFAKKLFPSCETYVGVYEKFGLLGEGTILAHCVHLDAGERDVIRRSGAGISHCPTSNLNINSGSARVGEMLDVGIKVGDMADPAECRSGWAQTAAVATLSVSCLPSDRH